MGQESNESHYIHQLTMQTMVNRDVLRKINERKQRENTASEKSNSRVTLRQLQEMVKELWEVTQTKDFSLDMNSVYPFELQKSFDQFVGQTRNYLEKHPEFLSNLPLSPSQSHTKSPIAPLCETDDSREEDTKQIHMLPVFMEKQHPLWNYNHFNRKKAVHAYPPNSQYHIPTTHYNSGYSGNNGMRKKSSYQQENMLFAEE